MTHNTIEDVYREFVMIRGNQRALFALVGESFLIERALYPGSSASRWLFHAETPDAGHPRIASE